METIAKLQRRLKNDLPEEGISHVIKSLKAVLPETSPKYNLLIELERDFKEIKINIIEGILKHEDIRLANAGISKRLLELIDLLEESDFDKNTKKSNLSPDQKIKKGHVLYKIPNVMQLDKESRCLVRIAFDKATLVEDLDIDEHTEFRTDVRISDYMKVEIADSANPDAFDIRSTSKPVQFIDQDDYTEWRFFVKPLLPGEHFLEIKVTIMLVIDGETRVREKVLEESVVIVSEEVEDAEPKDFKTMPEEFVMAEGVQMIRGKSISKKGMPQAARVMAMGLVFLMALSSVTYAFVPQEVDWILTQIRGDAEDYENYVQKYGEKENRHLEKARLKICLLKKESAPCREFLEKYPDSPNKEKAQAFVTEESENTADFDNTPGEITPRGTNNPDSIPNEENEETPNLDDTSGEPVNETDSLQPESENQEDENSESPPPPPENEGSDVEEPVATPVLEIKSLPSFTDSRDGQTYNQAIVGATVWLTENLNYEMSGSWCYGDNSDNCQAYGRMYNWEAAEKACPAGYRLPTKAEWENLLAAFGGYVDYVERKENGNSKLAYSKLTKIGQNEFSAQLGGGRYGSGSFNRMEDYGYFWTNTAASGNDAFYVGFAKELGKVYLDKYSKKDAFSCRCVALTH